MSIYISIKGSNSCSFKSSKRMSENISFIGEITKDLCNKFGFILNGISADEVKVALKLKNNQWNLNDYVTNQRGSMLQSFVKDVGDQIVFGGKEIGRYEFRPNITRRIEKINIKDDCAIIAKDSILVQNIVAHVMNPTPHIIIIASPSKALSSSPEYIILDTVNQLKNKSKFSTCFIIAILNSSLISWYVYRFIFANAIRTMHFDSPVTSRIPFPNLDITTPLDKSRHDGLVALVDQMLDTKKRLADARSESERTQLERKCTYLDHEIDKRVYELYDLTEEEIGIVEGNV